LPLGLGPKVRMDAFGTGFLVSQDCRIVTNHHGVEPWWKNEEIGEVLKQAAGIDAVVLDLTAYFPGDIAERERPEIQAFSRTSKSLGNFLL
jgi:hypothetical protein